MHLASLMPSLLLRRPPGSPPDRWLGARRLALAWLVLAAVLGVVARVTAPAQGHNYDVESYWIVSGIVDEGGNVYAETHRYKYAPAWFAVLGALRQVADLFPDPFLALRYLVAGLLTLVDVAIAAMLAARFGRLTAAIFLLHPVSILITGYHSQFDSAGIAVGLAGMLLVERGERAQRGRPGGIGGAWLAGVVLLGLSLVVKHVLFVLPLWLAFRQPTVGRAAVALLLPIAIFAASFVPWVAEGWEGIVDNVILYDSAENAPLLTWLLPAILERHLSPLVVFAVPMLLLGWWWRHRPPAELLLLSTVALVVFSPAVYTQYVAIPVAASIVFANLGYLAYGAVTSVFLLADRSNVGIEWLAELLPGFLVRRETGFLPFAYLVALLALGLVITLVELWRVRRAREAAA